jgi:hypothetical protein
MFKIKVKNQGYIKEAEVEFVPGLNVLRGKSSQGKSTLFRAVETTIFNMPSDFLVTYGEKTSSVTIEYNDHKIVRDRNLNAKEYKTVYYIDDQKYVKTGKNALEEVQEKIGLKELSISGSKTHIAFSSAFGLPFLVDESPQKIFDFITYSSSNLDISDVVQKIKSDIAENKEETKKLEIEINTLKDMFLKQQKKQIIFSENKDIDKISDSLKKLNSSFNELSSIVEKSTKILKEGERLKSIPKIDNVDLDYNSLLLLNKTLSNLDAIKKEIKENEEKYKINESILEKFPSFFNVSDFFNKNNELKNLTFENNQGRTVNIVGYSSNNNIIADSTFIKNSNPSSGTIYINSQYNSIINSTFIDNNATECGGAINYDSSGAYNSIINSTFIRNNAIATEFYGMINPSNGGAINFASYNGRKQRYARHLSKPCRL